MSGSSSTEKELASTIHHTTSGTDSPFVLEFCWSPSETSAPETLRCIESGFIPVVVDGKLIKDDCGHYGEHLWYRVCVK